MVKMRVFQRKIRIILYLLLAVGLVGTGLIQSAQAAVTLVRFEISASTSSSVTLEWETATEYNNLYFFITRSLAENGTYENISDYIFAEGTAVSGSIYQFIDGNVQAGKTYYYKLEAVDVNYASEFFGPLSVIPGAPTATASATSTATQTGTATVTGTIISSPSVTPSTTLTETSTPTSTETSPFHFSTNTRTFTATVTPPVTETPDVSQTASLEPSLTATEIVVKTSTKLVTETLQMIPTVTPVEKQSSPAALMGLGFLGVILVGGAALGGWIWYQRRSGEEI